MFSSNDKLFMERAFELAMECLDDEEVPVGAVIAVSYTHLRAHET